MSQTERILRIQQILRERKFVSRRTFIDELEVSPAQFKRDLAFLRDRFQAPIEYDAMRRAYCLREATADSPQFELPGPMYTSAEIHALLLMQDLVTQLQPGLLDQHLGPLRERLKLLLGKADLSASDVRRRIRILHMASRPVHPRQFRDVSQATLSRLRLEISYFNRYRAELTTREISPQRLVFYRGNWYVDSWCHLRQDLRSFAVDAIEAAKISSKSAREIAEDALNAHLGSGYGIFSGPAEQNAVLRFEPDAARWVIAEIWHSLQRQNIEPTGHLILTVPFAKEHELVMDILRYGPSVEVVSPKSLRDIVLKRLREALGRY
jgi:predicted DNA-binding transcriptional regulator YafY